MFKHYGNESDLTFQGILANCTAEERAYDFALFKGNVKKGAITINGLWPRSRDGICQSCELKQRSNIPSK
jgi:hypothetical protein